MVSVQISTSADGPHSPPLSATLTGFSIDAEEPASCDSVTVEAGGQIVVVEETISQTGDVSAGTDLPLTTMSTIMISFSKSPATNEGNSKKNPINKNGISDNSELIEARSAELDGIQYHVCGLSFSCRSKLKTVPVALKAVVHGDDDDDDGRVRDVGGMFVLVVSARAIGISMADRTNRARRVAILVVPGCLSGMLVVVSMACFTSGFEGLTSTFSGNRRPARRW